MCRLRIIKGGCVFIVLVSLFFNYKINKHHRKHTMYKKENEIRNHPWFSHSETKAIVLWHTLFLLYSLSSVQFSCSVMSDSLRPHESQHARPPCPSPTPGVHSDSRPSSPWCHPAISSSVSPSPPAPNPSQHQSLFQWVNSSHEVARVLEFQL